MFIRFGAFIFMMLGAATASAKELALTFDDAPFETTAHFRSEERTDALIAKLKALNVPQVMIFANPCKGESREAALRELKKYRDAGHLIGNHTCSHLRLDNVGFDRFVGDAARADQLLSPLMTGQKFFRFPTLNEGSEPKDRDRMRAWLKANHYRNGMVSIDDDDYIFSFKINQAKSRGRKIDYSRVNALFQEHVLGAVEFYDALAVKILGRSPKHVLLLHEMDATVMNLEALVKTLRARGWKIISPEEAYQDELYQSAPVSAWGGNGIIAQLALDRMGKKALYGDFEDLKRKIDRLSR